MAGQGSNSVKRIDGSCDSSWGRGGAVSRIRCTSGHAGDSSIHCGSLHPPLSWATRRRATGG